MPEDHRAHPETRTEPLRSGSGVTTPSTFDDRLPLREMGYTAAFEPAMVPANARHAHMEMADMPMIDKGGYVMLGNDDYSARHARAPCALARRSRDYVAWTLHASQAIGVKVRQPGRHLRLQVQPAQARRRRAARPHYGVTPRQIVRTLARAVRRAGRRASAALHCNNLGVPGNVETTLRDHRSARKACRRT